MPIGTSDGNVYKTHSEATLSVLDPIKLNPKQLADAQEINTNNTATDFQSRFYATDDKPLEPYVKPSQSPVDKLLGLNGDRYQLWPERAVRGAIDALALPGEVAQGKIDPGSTQAIEKAADLAGLMVMGPAPVAGKMVDGTLGSFAGVKSKTLDKAKLYEAQNMSLEGFHPDDIYNKTGFFRGAEGRWRSEIDDSAAKLKGLDVSPATPDVGWTKIGKPETVSLPFANKYGTPLSDIYDHPELYKAYPHLQHMMVEEMPHGVNAEGMYSGSTNTIYMKPGTPENFQSVLAHEVQHAIQKHEDFARGGNPNMFKSPKLDEAEGMLKNAEYDLKQELKNKGIDQKQFDQIKFVVKHNPDLLDSPNLHPMYKTGVEKAKELGALDKIKNIAEGEKLLEADTNLRYQKYHALMGEVESRNIQARLLLSRQGIEFRDKPPMWTEDVPRSQQIDSRYFRY